MESDKSRYTGSIPFLVIWCAGLGGMSVAAVTGEHWIFAAWAAAILLTGLSAMFVSVTLDAGTLEFRGAFRRRRYLATQLKDVERWPTSVMFRFDRASAMVLPLQGDDLDALLAQLRVLNPSIRRGGLAGPIAPN